MSETRRRDRVATRANLLSCARQRFTQQGYDATSVRDIAGDASVDPALVFRYFGSKKALFEEATSSADGSDPLDGPREELPSRLLRTVVFAVRSDGEEHPLVAMLRSSGDEATRKRLLEMCERYVAALEELAPASDASLRAELLSAWLLGIGVLRSAVKTPALDAASESDIAPYLDAVATALLGSRVKTEVEPQDE